MATFFGLPDMKPGQSYELALTDHQAWSLNKKHGVSVAGAPEEDPRPWANRCHDHVAHQSGDTAKSGCHPHDPGGP